MSTHTGYDFVFFTMAVTHQTVIHLLISGQRPCL